MKMIQKFAAAIAAFLCGPRVASQGRFRVNLEVRDENGNPVCEIPAGEIERVRFPAAIRLAGWLFLAGLTIAAVIYAPAVGWFVPILGRVATSGLNELLTQFILNTHYVGLMGAVSSTGATTASSTTFTDTNGTFEAGDVGRQILIMGAGAGGLDLLTTIAARASATSITLGNAASVSLTGARYAFECRAADTMASHTSFSEDTNYTQGARVTWTPGSVSGGSVDNSASPAVFAMNATTYIFGAFLTDNNTKGGSTGTLYGAGVSSGGVVARILSGYTINATVTPSVTAT